MLAGGLVLANAALAQSDASTQDQLKGLWLTTPYPSLTERIGDNVTLDLTLRNMNMPPERVAVSVDGLPDGWTYEIDGGGNAVTEAMVEPNSSRSLTLKITPTKDVKTGTYKFTVAGRSDATPLDLPVTLALAEAKPDQVTLDPKLPALRGTPKSSFDFDVTVKNDGASDQTYNLIADGPPGFETTFQEQYGTQELTSIPLKAGESKDLKVSVKLPQNVAAGQYQVTAEAASPTVSGKTELVLDVTGQPTLSLAGPEGRLSGDATAGKARTFKFTLENTGTAPAQNVKMTASAPSGWKVDFDPKTIDAIAPNDTQDVNVSITPSDKAIAGDFVVRVNANGSGASDNASFRVTVLTSTMWGIAGLGIIGAAVVALAFAVTRYGRR
jgi:uncharacterized repeat protein (TIGR01451 family)